MTYKDATLCKGTGCPHKNTCKRYLWYNEGVKSDEIMSVFETPPYTENTEKNSKSCEYYWGDNQTNILEQLNDIVNGNDN